MSKKNKIFEKKKVEEEKLNTPIDEEPKVEQPQETAPEESTTAEADTEVGKIEQLESELAELKDKYLRHVAEFDNFRKRTLKEKAELILNGGEKVISALLPVLDDFERAKANMNKSNDLDALKEGVNLIEQKLTKTLESQGLKKIDTENADFNTDFHEAIAMIPAPADDLKGKVVDCVQTGYQLNEKVIRHAKVAVGQ